MPVQKQLIPVQMGGGINQKPDPKQLQAGQLLTLQNGQFSKTGQINKRFGYDILSKTIEGGGAITAGVQLANYQDELILLDGTNLYTYLSATGNWSNRGTCISITTEDKDIVRSSSASQSNPDMAYLNGIEVYAAEDSRGGIHYAVLDSETKAFALSDTQLSSFGKQPKTIAFQNQIFIFYSDGGNNLYYQTVNPFNPTVVQPAVIIAGDGYAGTNGFPYDVSVVGSKLVVAYISGTQPAGVVQFFSLDAGFNKSTTTTTATIPGIAVTPTFHGAMNVVGDSALNIWVSWGNGSNIYSSAWSYTGTPLMIINPLLNYSLVDPINGLNIVNITAVESYTAQQLLVFYEVQAGSAVNEFVKYNTVSTTSVGTPQTIRSVGLASKAWKYNNNVFVNTAYESTLQSTDFTFYVPQTGTPTIVAKETPSVGGGLQSNGMCPETVSLSAGVYKFANLQAGKIQSQGNTLFAELGINSTKLSFVPSNNFINTTQANTLLIVGGILQGYDGVSTSELGFNIYPEDILYSPLMGGSLAAGTYQYQVEFQWTDNNAKVYHSAPSIAISVPVTAGQSILLTGPTLRLTSKSNVSIVIYRTAADGTTFLRIGTVTNSTTTDTWSFTDTGLESTGELEYTTGNILANIAPPANAIITTYNNRVYLAGLSDKLLMWYSQSVVDTSNQNTIPPQFCQELTVAVDPRGGDITALGLLNQSLIIFKNSQIFSIQGNGPNATGNDNDLQDPTLVTSDVGCTNQNSVVIVPMGLMFQSSKGIYLLDQSLNVNYIGSPVEDSVANLTITSAIQNEQDNQVIFTTQQGISLVYDYYVEQWSTWTNQYAADSAMYNDLFAFLTPAGQVYVQNRSKFTDGASPVYLSWTLPNLSFAGIQGYQRVFRCYVLGTYKGPHTLNAYVAYDYNDTYTQMTSIQPSNNVSTWGSDATWGSGAFWGGQFQLYEFRIDFNIQKCTAIRIMFTDNQTSTYNEGYAISSVVFEVGILPGGNRLPATKTYGAR